MTPLSQLNLADRAGFVAVCGPLFEHSPWVAERTYDRASVGPPLRGGSGTPAERGANGSVSFPTREALHAALCDAMYGATVEEQLKLIASHPDLVGRLAKEGRLTAESTGEQAAAGLAALTGDEAAAFDRYNGAYRERFGFPFVICARENKKDAILAAFPVRLRNTREQEITTALGEIAKIARLRLYDAVSEV